MIVKTYKPAEYKDLQQRALSMGIVLPEPNQQDFCTHAGVTMQVSSFIRPDGRVSVTGIVTKHPWLEPISVIEAAVQSQL